MVIEKYLWQQKQTEEGHSQYVFLSYPPAALFNCN